jgi:hypothetical protein
MGCFARRVRSNALPLALSGVAAALVVLLFATDRRLGLHQFASTRYRFHAIPVAVSTVYHGRTHDYTAFRNLAMRFQDADKRLDDQIRQAVHPDYDIGGGTYFWVADDRGLADFVIGAFRLFGPKTRSLSKFYFVLLGLALALYAVGYWRTPAALTLPVLVLLGWLAIAQVMLHRVPFPNGQGYWGEEIALYESRMFDVLALVSVLHLAVLAGVGPRVSRLAWLTAVPQAALLIFLYHARSSIGWQYLALFALAAARVAWWVVSRLRSAESPPSLLARPLFVSALLVLSVVGLKQYQQARHHRDYVAEYGRRTFWHNALMGLAYHPGLRDELPMKLCDDRDAVDLVLKRMGEKNPDLDRNVWNWQAALNSLGNHNQFDWNGYEAAAREIYVSLWSDRPDRMAACYAYYKPADVARQVAVLGGRLGKNVVTGRAWEFVAGVALSLAALAGVVRAARRDEQFRAWLRSLSRVVLLVLPFSLIPGIAFYPALTTVACFYLLGATLAGLLVVRFVAHASSKRR